MKVHFLRHAPFEGPAKIADWGDERNHGMKSTELWNGGPLPSLADFDLLVVMGGPMSVHDEARYPWLAEEKRLIARSLEAGKRVLGVCLGAQMIADVLGAKVYKNPVKEIGWFPIRLCRRDTSSAVFDGLPDSFMVFHWHGETFDLPAGAVHLAESYGCKNQAFAFRENALGLQFHLETTRESASELIKNCGGEIGSGPFEQPSGTMLAATKEFAALEPILYKVLDRFAGTGPSLRASA